MATISHQWNAYACLQSKLAATSSTTIGGALEEALNIIHQADFRPDAVDEGDLLRISASAGRKERRRNALCRQVQALALEQASTGSEANDSDISSYTSSPDDVIHARRELLRISEYLSDQDWDLLIDVAAGAAYSDLATRYSSTPTALRSRVCRLRRLIGRPSGKPH